MGIKVMSDNKPALVGDAANRAGIRKWFIKNLVAPFIVTGALLLAAGRVEWIWGWIFGVMMVVNLLLMVTLLIPRHPDLIVERSELHQGTKKWDLVLAPFMAYFTLITALAAALDVRFGWSVPISLLLHLVGLVLVGLGFGLMLWAMLANRFFGPTVRIQAERGHETVSDGPYRFVRHPGYFAMVLTYAGMPLFFGSRWAYLSSAIGLAATFTRTALEDATLRQELPGYREFALKTRSRLIPGIW
jgi:protein-S-isoprenylcysteine O-methyltransferase Ste14